MPWSIPLSSTIFERFAASSINSFFVFSTYFYLSLGRGSIISTPNQLFSTSDLENFTNRPGDNLENLYPTSHGPFLPNFLQITPTASRSLSTKLISTPIFTHYLLLLTAIKNKPEENRTSSSTPTYNFTIYLTIYTIYEEMRFDTQAFLSLSLSTRAEIFCEMIARFFFPVDFLPGLYRDSPGKNTPSKTTPP